MPPLDTPRIGYVVKRYPRYSETFIVNEILAHEAAGAQIEIFSLKPTDDTHFQDILARVRAPVTYLPDRAQKATEFWAILQDAATVCPEVLERLHLAVGTEVKQVMEAVALAAHVRRRGITHLHAHFATSATTVARLAAKFADVPYSFTAHAKDIFHEAVDPRDLGAKLCDAAAVVTVSDFNLDHLRTHFGACADRVHRIYNGLDLQRFSYREPAVRERLIVSVGRLVEKKGLKYLVAACDILRQRGESFRCVIVGSGEEQAKLQAQVDALGLGDLVALEGPRPQREVMELVQSAAVFASPCIIGEDGDRDGLPTVLLESMALGTPCVGTDVTGIPEVIIDGETGLCVPQHDAAALADALARLLADAPLRVHTARNARTLIEAEFDARQNAGRIYQLFTQAAPPLTAKSRMTA